MPAIPERKITLTLILVASLLTASHCASTIPVQVVSAAPEGVDRVMEGGRHLGVVFTQSDRSGVRRDAGQSEVVTSAIVEAIQSRQFFTLVDLGDRAGRLSELQYLQSGLARETREIGRELAIDALLTLSMPRAVAQECQVRREYVPFQECIRTNSDGSCAQFLQGQREQRTAELSTTIYLQARLTNIESGESLYFSNSDPVVVRRPDGDPSCPSLQEGFSTALKTTAQQVAARISPERRTMRIALDDSLAGIDRSSVDRDLQRRIQAHLKEGVSWSQASPPDQQRAREEWQTALQLSGNRSAAAAWNLAASYWNTGDLDQAERYFNTAFSAGESGFTSQARRAVISSLQSEREREEREKRRSRQRR